MPREIEIAGNIRRIEELECEILRLTAELFDGIRTQQEKTDLAETLAKLSVSQSLLTARLGISRQTVERKEMQAIRLALGKTEDATEQEVLLGLISGLKQEERR